MKAIGYLHSHAIDHPDALIDIELPMPDAKGRDLLIQVHAISVNPVDCKVRCTVSPANGDYKVLGWDAVGEVVAVGDQVELFKTGDSVWYAGDLTRPGSNSEYQLVDERITALKPASLSNIEAAALPLTAITAWELLFDRLGFTAMRQDTPLQVSTESRPAVLIIGAAGGVGSILIQLASRLTDAIVIATASRESSQDWVTSLGANYVINHHQPLAPQLEEINIQEVTHVISLTHTDQHYDQIVDVLAPQGKFALIDDPKENIDILKLKKKSASLHWEFMFTRSMFSTRDMLKQHELLTALAELVDAGEIKTTLGEDYGTINAENLKRAHAHIESGRAVGKIVLAGF